MKRCYFLCLTLLCAFSAQAQFFFDVEVDTSWYPSTVVMPPSPLKYQVLFVGQTDKVQTTPTYGNPAGEALAKQWHDFIGFTPDDESEDLGWVSVNHEMIEANDQIGDGGGMTVFKVRRDPITDTLIIVEQTLSDGRSGQFFNVDFVNTVGETGMNCGGITSTVDGRIWTAEEWFRGSNESISPGVRDQSPFTISTDIPGNFAGQTIEKYQNFNWMVEIDPREAKAIRKQYNWGRQPFEGGVIMPDNRTVYTGGDDTPGLFSKFVADEPGDFTKGKLYVYKHDADGPEGPWVEMNSMDLNEMLHYQEEALSKGATMFNRLEWLATDGEYIYMAETGRDNPARGFQEGAELGGVLDYHWLEPVRARHPRLAEKTDDQVLDFVMAGFYEDYYGRVLKFDPNSGVVETYLEGGPYYEESPEISAYPEKHLTNPDGLNILTVNGAKYMVINEDLNGTSNARTPAGVSNRTCEAFLLDMSIAQPTVEDLIRISVVPVGAEVTGACPTPDGKTLLINSQHPSSSNPFPYNNSLTYAITGWDEAVSAITDIRQEVEKAESCQPYVNPVERTLVLCEASDVAIYGRDGKRLFVIRNAKEVDLHGLSGMYIAQIYGLESRQLEGTKLLVKN
jgi:secreted PhoX family phosphatase